LCVHKVQTVSCVFTMSKVFACHAQVEVKNDDSFSFIQNDLSDPNTAEAQSPLLKANWILCWILNICLIRIML